MNAIDIEHLLERAATLEKENDYDEALRLYNRVLEADPDNETAYDRRRAIRNNTLVVVIEPNPVEKRPGYAHYIDLDGNRLCDGIYARQETVNIERGKHRLELWHVGLGANATPHRLTSYEFVVSKNEQKVYLRWTEKDMIHFSDLEHENGTIAEFKNGCYVATAVYGSYDCPQVWTLRRFRDYTLAETWYGRAFIRTYYAISPTLVKWFGKTAWFKNLWKPTLDRMVKKLNASGVDDTPYRDIEW